MNEENQILEFLDEALSVIGREQIKMDAEFMLMDNPIIDRVQAYQSAFNHYILLYEGS